MTNDAKGKMLWSGWFALAALGSVPFLFSWHALTSIYQDIGRHLTIGQLIWESGTIPKTNLFSYTAPDFPFVNHHWLAEVLLFLGERVIGLKGLIAAKAVMMTTAFGLVFAAAWRRTILVPSLLVGLVAILIVAERTDVRPEIFSFLFLGWYLFVLYRYPQSRLIWTLPFVQLLWVNSHIYFFMGPFVFIAWTVGLLVTDGPNVLRGRRIWLLAAAIAAATMANPWFLTGALYPLNVFDNYGYSIVENKSYFFLRAFGYPGVTFGAMLLGLLLYVSSLVLNRARIRENVMGMLLVGGTAVLGFMMIRNLPLFGLVFMPATMRNLVQSPVRWPGRGAGAFAILFLLIGVSTLQGQFYGYLGRGSRQFGLHVPQGHQRAVDYFIEKELRGPIFNNFDIGSYLIWKLPDESVFIDGRPEAYPAEFIQDTYVAMQENAKVWTERSAAYGLNAIIWNIHDMTPWSQSFLTRLVSDPDWLQAYSDGVIAIWVRNTAENRALIGRPDEPAR